MKNTSVNKNRTSKKSNTNIKNSKNNLKVNSKNNNAKNIKLKNDRLENRNVKRVVNSDIRRKKTVENKKVAIKKVNTQEKVKDIRENKINNDIKKFPVKNKEENIKNKKVNNRKKILLVSVFFTIGIVICSIYLLFSLTIFELKEISITGNKKYTNSEIISKSNYKLNENIFLQYIKYKNDILHELPYVESVNVSIVFPDKINLEIVERTSKYIAFDKEKNKYFKLDKDGYILEETSLDKKSDKEMLVYNITFDNKVELGTIINEIDLDKLRIYEKIAEEYNKVKINGNITRVDFKNSLTTITLNDKLNVIFPNDTNLKYNMDLLNSILKKNGDLQGVIDMTKSDPVFSIF